ncbi:MAG: DUF1822 family protein [Cyanobacteria bacterium P01_D01_bin.6]
MISPLEQQLKISIPLTRVDRSKASDFANQQLNPSLVDKTYLNTLAILATQRYFQMINIESDLSDGYSWNIANRLIGDVSDLFIPECNMRLECRPISSGSKTCWIPRELWTDRIGYVAVEIDAERSKATLLGFFSTAFSEEMPLSNLQSLDELIDTIESESNPSLNRLLGWLNGVVDNQWNVLGAYQKGGIAFAGIKKEVEQLYASQMGKNRSERGVPASMSSGDALAHLIRSTDDEGIRRKAIDLLTQLKPDHHIFDAIREKDLSVHIDNHSAALRIIFIPRTDSRYSVLVRVYATGSQRFLPKGLRLIVLDEEGNERFSYPAGSNDDWIECPLILDEGDHFSIRVALGKSGITEPFVI